MDLRNTSDESKHTMSVENLLSRGVSFSPFGYVRRCMASAMWLNALVIHDIP